MKHVFFFIFILTAFIRSSFAEYFDSFIEFNGTPSYLGSGAGTVISNNSDATLSNPACLINLEKPELGLSYSPVFQQARHGSIIYARPIGQSMGIGIGVLSLISYDIEEVDKYANVTGKNFKETKIGTVCSFTFRILESLSLGLSTKGLYHSFYGAQATAYSLSAGILFEVPVYKKIAAGLYFDNIYSSQFELYGKTKKLPLRLKAGVGYVNTEFRNLGIKIESNYSSASSKEFMKALSLGGEIIIKKILFLRSGLNGDFRILSGIGLKLGDALLLDYSISPHSELGYLHSFSLTMQFGKSKHEIYEEQRKKEELSRKTEEEIQKKRENKKQLSEEIDTNIKDKNWDRVIELAEELLKSYPNDEKVIDILNLAKKEKGLLTIAVIDIEPIAPITSADTSFMSEFFRDHVVKSKLFKLVDRKNMELILAEQGFQQTGCTEEECVIKMGKLLNVRKVITGNCGQLGNYYVLTLKMIDVETGEIVSTTKMTWQTLDPDIIDKTLYNGLKELIKNLPELKSYK